DRGYGTQGDARLIEGGLACRRPLKGEAGKEQDPRRAPLRRLDELPELHRQGERDEGDRERRQRRGREHPEAVEEQRDWYDERREVRAAAGREAGRPRFAAPARAEAPLLGGCNRAVLGAVQME